MKHSHSVTVAARALGASGGRTISPAKVEASRRNGRLGGRPPGPLLAFVITPDGGQPVDMRGADMFRAAWRYARAMYGSRALARAVSGTDRRRTFHPFVSTDAGVRYVGARFTVTPAR